MTVTAWLAAAAAFLIAIPAGQAADNMKAFPPAEQGMARHVLQLPHRNDESALKVELIVGKTVQLDEHNRYFFGGKIEAETVKGWGIYALQGSEARADGGHADGG